VRARRGPGGGWIAFALALGVLIWNGHRLVAEVTSTAPVPASTAWPEAGARLHPGAPTFPPGFGVKRVTLDAGHGAENNSGNTSCLCVAEQDFTRAAALEMAARLEATGHFEVQLTRVGAELVPYADRVDDAEVFAADAFVSLHSDVRGSLAHWSPEVGETCPIAGGGVGFSVLYSDEGDDAGLVDARHRLARALAGELERAGFAAYDGGYELNYDGDATRGVYVDRHAEGQRIFVLRKPSMPAVLLETHNALDPREAERWADPATWDAAADALADALVSTLGAAQP
jgi:N-acetylmuramoyl-L-alanine amidase